MAKTATKKSGPRFNIFDVLIILAVLACIAAIVLRIFFLDDEKQSYSYATVEFVISDISEVTADAFCKPNRKIYLQSNNEEIGTLTAANYDALTLFKEDAEGKLVEVKHPDKKEVTATATLRGVWSEDGFLIGGTTLATVGSTVNIYTKDVACTMTVSNVIKQ